MDIIGKSIQNSPHNTGMAELSEAKGIIFRLYSSAVRGPKARLPPSPVCDKSPFFHAEINQINSSLAWRDSSLGGASVAKFESSYYMKSATALEKSVVLCYLFLYLKKQHNDMKLQCVRSSCHK